MAAPSGITWSSTVDSYYRLGIYVNVTSSATQSAVSIEVWLWSKWSLSDGYNRYYFNNNASSATTLAAQNINLSHSGSSGAGWSTSNQTKLGSYSYAYNRGTSNKTIYCAAKIANLGSNESTISHSVSYTIPILASYTVSYNANGGTGAPSSQTKWHGTSLTLSSAKPTRTGYSFLGWSTSSTATTATYTAGDDYAANTAATLYAVWKADTYTVSYDANGGTGAPSSQTKTHGVDLTLSSTKPTKANYNFLGWSTSATATTATYTAGASYTSNAAIKLYAVWELAYVKPRIVNFLVNRCDEEGNVSDEGTCFKIAFDWAADYEISSIIVEWKDASSDEWISQTIELEEVEDPPETPSGSVESIFGNNEISTELAYDVKATVSDVNSSTMATSVLPSLAFPIDFLAGGKGVAFGKPADTENLFDVNFDAWLRHKLTVDGTLIAQEAEITSTLTSENINVVNLYDKHGKLVTNGLAVYETAGIDPDTTLDHLIITSVSTPNGTFMYIKTEFYSDKSTSSNRMQTAFPYNKKSSPYYRYYLNGAWSDWVRIREGVTYSTTEQATGDIWIDGKPIYRKVISFTVTTLNVSVSVATISNFGGLVNMTGRLIRPDSGSSFPASTFYYSNSNYHNIWFSNGGVLNVRTSTALKGDVVVEYTKNT